MGSDWEHSPVAGELATAQLQQETQEGPRGQWHTQQRCEIVEEEIQRHPQEIRQKEEQELLQEQQEVHCIPNSCLRITAEAAAPVKRGADAQQHLSALQRRQEGCLMVLKIGTSTLMTEHGGGMHMSLQNIGRFVDLVCELRERGHAVVVVSSGAVGVGCVTLHFKQRPEQVNMKQAVASVGQCRLMRLYEDLFGLREQKVAQLLVSRHDLVHQKSYQNFRSSLRALLTLNVIPVINENDSVATEELRFGDNDTLAAHIAVAVEAKWLFILTDVDCLYDKNPHKHPDARPVALVDRLTDVYAFLSEKECGGWGTGGMYTKVVASKIATNMGVHVAITHGQHPFRILGMFSYVETHFGRLASAPVPLTPLQQQSRRPSTASIRSNGKASAEDSREEKGKIPPCKNFLGGERYASRSTVAATAPSVQEGGGANRPVAIPSRLGTAASGAGNVCGSTTATSCSGYEWAAADSAAVTSDQAVSALQDVNAYASGSRNIGECPCDSLLDYAARSQSVSRGSGHQRDNDDSVAGLSEKNNCSTDGLGSSITGDPVGHRRESECCIIFAAAPEEKVELQTSPCEQGDTHQQKSLQVEGSPPRTCRAAAGQQRQRRLLEGNQQGSQARPSLMICKNLQQMPFLGTVFLATSLTAHKRGDTKAWILSLPVRGTLFVDKGAVEALVQQKKSLFAAGVRRVVGNFTASECVAVYFDTCYDVRPPDSSKGGSAGSCRRLTAKRGSINVRRGHSGGTNKQLPCTYDGAATDQSRSAATGSKAGCCSGEGAESGRLNMTEDGLENIQNSEGEQRISPDTERCRSVKTQNGGLQVAACASNSAAAEEPSANQGNSVQKCEREISAIEKHESASVRNEREQTGTNNVISSEKASTQTGRRGRGCCCPTNSGERTRIPDSHTALLRPAATPARNACVADRGLLVASHASTMASGDVDVPCDASAACLDAAVVSECPIVSESSSLKASGGIGEYMLAGPVRGLAGPPESLEIARCISNFSSAELQVIKGKKSSEFKELLGYPVDDEVAHRQHIVFTFMNGHEVLKQFCLGPLHAIHDSTTCA